MIKLNLGAGAHCRRTDFINIDRVKLPGIDHVVDLEREQLPLNSDSVDYIWCSHVLEHLRDVQNVLNEAWRVLRPGGEFEVKVPWGLWRGAQKPVHYQCITDCWFDWLRRDDIWEWYGYRSWVIKKMNIRRGDEGPFEIHVILIPKK